MSNPASVPRERPRSLLVAAVGATALLIGTGVLVRDPEAIVIGVGLGLGFYLLGIRSGLVGRIVLFLLFADVIGWMLPAWWSNARHAEAGAGTLVPLGLVVLSAAGIACVFRLADRWVALAAVMLFAAGVVAPALPSMGAPTHPVVGALALSERGATFSTTRLQATSGAVTIVVRNHDLFWHTFTIDALHVGVRSPLGSTRVVAFDARPGTYAFYCAIPGHKAAGMKGTLTVR